MLGPGPARAAAELEPGWWMMEAEGRIVMMIRSKVRQLGRGEPPGYFFGDFWLVGDCMVAYARPQELPVRLAVQQISPLTVALRLESRVAIQYISTGTLQYSCTQ